VNQGATTAVVASSSNPSTYNGSVTFTATVTGAAATGTVTFRDGVTVLGSGALSSGTAAVTTSSLNAGAHSITAEYGGDANHTGSTSPPLTQTVDVAGQTITFAPLPAKAFGDADFAPGATASSGLTVTYASSNTAVATIVSGMIHIVSVGTATIIASQGGNSNYAAAPDVTQALTVNRAATTTTVSSSSTSIPLGGSVTLTASITGLGVTGTVTFSDGATNLGTVSLSGGTASLTAFSLSAGPHLITASYSGDTSNAPSVSAALTVVVLSDGDLNGDGVVTVADALKALRIAMGLDATTASDLAHGDVAPLLNGTPQFDGKIDVSDVVLILRKAAGLTAW
jgi:hypothetical protein